MSRYISPVLYVLLMLVGCAAFISIAGVRVGVFEPLTGFSLLKQSVYAALVLSILAAASLFVCRRECNVASKRFFGLVLVLSLVYSIMWIVFYAQRCHLPSINDITTDTQTPPAYLNVNFLRKSSDNSLSYNSDWAPIQEKYYPDVKPVFTKKTVHTAFKEALKLVKEKGWQVDSTYAEVGLIEATARTPIFGFRDDVVIRIMKQGDDVRIDMRSCSRVGKGDYGVNAQRVVNFMDELDDRLNGTGLSSVRYLN